ncbi:23S rRNA (adenine(2030)-N(6))-methyltransferase RlmJ [Pelomicrobium sp.]|uniref:23S rRNA (adenine(2030)-N(6))-methyltransferase RlmJ n=1 Tax=Pelomicrobium sp. TaxID=2815319 RepID=UPI002FDD9524
MLAYRHLFHAGNFADCFKHALLAQLIRALARKEPPFFYLDTHAGAGRYDLQHEWACKLTEWKEGIGRLWDVRPVPEALAPYLACVRAENPDGTLRFYPGSPAIARRLMRAQDRLVATELNKADCAALQALFETAGNTTVACMDGYQALRAFLPPKERRGLVLMDSSFDRAGEYERIAEALRFAHRRWQTGLLAFWYPLMAPGEVRAFERSVVEGGVTKILKLTLAVHPAGWSASLRGCGMLIVNPPWNFEVPASAVLAWLWERLSMNGAGGWEVEWLVPEPTSKAMKTSPAARRLPADVPRGRRPPPANPRLYAQTRKVLSQHYRAKYGVKK